jgi:hypothetical protein
LAERDLHIFSVKLNRLPAFSACGFRLRAFGIRLDRVRSPD